MYAIVALGSVVFGAILGSFVNALSFRFGTGDSALSGRSHCMQCGRTLSALDLIPILSFLFLRGHCRYCGVRLSLQYPLVELAAAGLSLFFFMHFFPFLPEMGQLQGAAVAYAFSLVFSMIVLFAVSYDIRHMLLPRSALWLLGGLSLFSLFFSCDAACELVIPSLGVLLAGPVVALPLLALSAFSRGRWMGWGDGLLMLSFGWVLGTTLGLSALMYAFWVGAVVGLFLVAYGKMKSGGGVTMSSEIPFAPFLALGAAIAYAFNVNMIGALFI